DTRIVSISGDYQPKQGRASIPIAMPEQVRDRRLSQKSGQQHHACDHQQHDHGLNDRDVAAIIGGKASKQAVHDKLPHVLP
ncbi:MAG: hypothetical protein J0626_04590, partial [Rhodospirillaceae bacterium]|nr:hypothetical protein [Rhodospirillaceae bacterium]